MIEIKGNEFYTASDLIEILKIKYPSIIKILKKKKCAKYKGMYIISKEETEELKKRNQRINKLTFEEKMKQKISKNKN